jgi:outer membrane protein TolC
VRAAAAFYAAAGNDELVTARRHGIEVAKQTLDNARARLAAGVTNRVDVTRAEQALVRAEQSLREQEDARAASYRALATLLQLRDPFQVVAEAMPAEVPESIDELVAEGLKLRPELLALERQLRAADGYVLSAKLKWLPSLSAFGLFRLTNAAGFSGQPWAVGVGAQVDWLIYDAGLRLAQERQFESVAVETGLRRAQLRDTISDDIRNLREALTTRRQAVDSARHEAALADETLRLTRVQRDAGTATQLDLLQAQDALINAEVTVARARFEVGLAAVQLKRAAGLFPGAAK